MPLLPSAELETLFDEAFAAVESEGVPEELPLCGGFGELLAGDPEFGFPAEDAGVEEEPFVESVDGAFGTEPG